jgi:hypothetical protein
MADNPCKLAYSRRERLRKFLTEYPLCDSLKLFRRASADFASPGDTRTPCGLTVTPVLPPMSFQQTSTTTQSGWYCSPRFSRNMTSCSVL